MRRERFKVDGCGGKVMDVIWRSDPPGLTHKEIVRNTGMDAKRVCRAFDVLLNCRAIMPCDVDSYFPLEGGSPGERRILRKLFAKKKIANSSAVSLNLSVENARNGIPHARQNKKPPFSGS